MEKDSPHQPGADAITRALVEIVDEVGPGGRIPSERLLAEQLGVSRTALRDRLQLLESFGVLRRSTGSGTYVQPLAPDRLAFALEVGMNACGLDMASLHSVRVGLERQAAIEAAAVQDPGLVARLGQQVLAMEQAKQPEDLDRADLAFHAALFEAAGNPALIFFARALAGPLQSALLARRAQLRRLAHDQTLMVHLHDAIHRAVESGSGIAAAAAVDAHFSTFQRSVSGPWWPADRPLEGENQP
jgi:GntR family transcriptional repressor for pyruvate dehydrogenase complex